MLEFRPVTLDDRGWVTECMQSANCRGSDYAFANLYNWAPISQIYIAKMEKLLIVRSGTDAYGYLFPMGEGDVRPALEEITKTSAALGHPLLHYNLPRTAADMLEALYPGRFIFRPQRNDFDYIYLRESLATLAGKKLHGKRNHITRFRTAYPDWQYETLSPANLSDAWEMNQEWFQKSERTEGLANEAVAVQRAFENFSAEGLLGGLLRAGGRVVAYTMGSPVTDDTFDVHFEKAFSEVEGAYTMINQQFVQHELDAYTYVNREDDVGDEGLRRAKLSYQPAFLYERFEATERKEDAI